MKVGFVSLSVVAGAPIARAIADHGWSLYVWRDDPHGLDGLQATPHQVCETLGELGRTCDVVIFREVHDVEGTVTELLANMAPGNVLVNNMSTVEPSINRRLEEMGSKVDVGVLDAPVSGDFPTAPGQRWPSMMVGGDKSTYEQCRALLEDCAEHVTYLGPIGAGELGKLINSAVAAANLKAAGEALAFGEALGLEVQGLFELLRTSSGGIYILEVLPPGFRIGLERFLELYGSRLEILGAEARAQGIPPSSLEALARAGLDDLPGTFRRLEATGAFPELRRIEYEV
jgi:2-hydroxy-3-oxopropionate reductase